LRTRRSSTTGARPASARTDRRRRLQHRKRGCSPSRQPAEPGGLILVTPFDSLVEVARAQYPWLPVRLLFRHPMTPPTICAAPMCHGIVAAGRDTLIPPSGRTRLGGRSQSGVSTEPLRCRPQRPYDRPEFRTAMDEALRSVLGLKRGVVLVFPSCSVEQIRYILATALNPRCGHPRRELGHGGIFESRFRQEF
jgi:hypothetical protein